MSRKSWYSISTHFRSSSASGRESEDAEEVLAAREDSTIAPAQRQSLSKACLKDLASRISMKQGKTGFISEDISRRTFRFRERVGRRGGGAGSKGGFHKCSGAKAVALKGLFEGLGIGISMKQ